MRSRWSRTPGAFPKPRPHQRSASGAQRNHLSTVGCLREPLDVVAPGLERTLAFGQKFIALIDTSDAANSAVDVVEDAIGDMGAMFMSAMIVTMVRRRSCRFQSRTPETWSSRRFIFEKPESGFLPVVVKTNSLPA